MKDNKKVLYSDDALFDMVEELAQENEGLEESYHWDEASAIIADEWDNMIDALQYALSDKDVLAIVDIGRWNGRSPGYKLTKASDVSDIFTGEEYAVGVWIDGYKNVRASLTHHDGTHYVLLRGVKKTTGSMALARLLNDIVTGKKISSQRISRLTFALGEKVEEAYNV